MVNLFIAGERALPEGSGSARLGEMLAAGDGHSDTTVPPSRRYVAAALIAAGALALRWPQMSESIWYDEYCRTTLHLNAESVGRILRHDVHNPLYNAFMYAWTALFGDSELSIRLPSLLAAFASVAALAWWTSRRFGRAIGWATAATLASSPVHVWYSGEAKNTMFVIATSVFALIAVDLLARRTTRLTWAMAVIAPASALWTDFVTAFAVVPAFIAALAARGDHGGPLPNDVRRRRGLGVASAALMVLALVMPLVIFKAINIGDAWRTYLGRMTAHEAWRLLCGKLMLGDAILPGGHSRNYIAMGLTVPVALAAFGGCRLLLRDRSGIALVITFALPIPVVWVVSELLQVWKPGPERNIYQLRNLVVMLCPYFVVLCAGLWTLRERWMRVAIVSLMVVANTTGSVLMQTLYRDRPTVMHPNPHWREIAETISAAEIRGGGTGATDTGPRHPDGRSSPVFLSKSPVHPLKYYWRSSGVVWLNASTSGVAGIVDLPIVTSGAPLFYVDNLDWDALSGEERAMIEQRFRMVEIAARGPVHVYRLLAEK